MSKQRDKKGKGIAEHSPHTGIYIGILVLIIVAALSWLALQRIENQSRMSIEDSLQSTLEISTEALNNWVAERQERLGYFVERPDIVLLIEKILESKPDKESLVKNDALRSLRGSIAIHLADDKDLGFFVINSDKITVGSMRDINLGTTNTLIDNEEHLDNIFRGKAQIILPVRSEVQLPGLSGKMSTHEPTMFIGVPVFGVDKKVIAAFTVRIDPSKDFTRVLRVGRTGKSAETMAFNNEGRLITGSLFDELLHTIGLVKKSDRAILSLGLRDPGGNMLEGFVPTIEREKQPFTLPVTSALQGGSGVNVDGYRNYMGVLVVGAWLWNDDFNFGIVTEVDVDEAFAPLYAISRTVAILLAFISLLFAGLMVTLLGKNRQAVYTNNALAIEAAERERINDALLVSEAKVSSILENVVDAIITIDSIGTIHGFNRAAENLFGYGRVEVLGQNVKMLMPSPHQEKHDTYLANYNRTNEKKIIGIGREVEGLRKDSSTFPLDLSVSEVVHDGISTFTGIIRDITTRKEMELSLSDAKIVAESANSAKSEFLASMSHEIRTPMNAILGMSELLADTELNDEQSEYVERFRRAGETLLNLINDILDLSKVESGTLVLDESSFAINNLVEKVVSIFTYKAHGKSLELAYHVSAEVPEYVIGDESRLRQVLVNLIGNAIKFTKEGEVVLRVGVVSADFEHADINDNSTVQKVSKKEKEELRECINLLFSVTDTGVGIKKEKFNLIFDKFSQADSTTTRDFGGTGLGLAISKRIVGLMHGDMWVESVVGEGSTFSFLAYLKASDRRSADADNYEQSMVGVLGGVKTLIIDDNSTNRWIMLAALQSIGIVSDEAASGEEGLGKLRESVNSDKVYDLLLLDCCMPELDGFGVIDVMKNDPQLENIKVLMLTSGERGTDRARIKELGMSSYLVKPVSRSTLLHAVAVVLGKNSLLPIDYNSVESSITVQGEPAKAIHKRSLDILLVDDSDDNRLLVERFLKDEPYAIDTAVNGKAAVEKFTDKKYDLVLLDLEMPVMDGYTAIGLIRSLEASERRTKTPVLALTAYALKGDAEKSIAAGFDFHLTKPIKRKILKQAILQYT